MTYIVDTTGTVNNTFLGDVKVLRMFPSGAGSFAQAARRGTDSGANWSQVSDTTPDDDTKYVTDGTMGDRHSYAFSDVVLCGGSILGVMTWTRRTTQAHEVLRQLQGAVTSIRQARYSHSATATCTTSNIAASFTFC